MRWLILGLLCMGVAFDLHALCLVASNYGQNAPIAIRNILILLLAGSSGVLFLAAAIGLVWPFAPDKWWRRLLLVSAGLSIALGVSSFAPVAVPAMAIDVVLIWGVIGKGWSTDKGNGTAASPAPERIHPLMFVPVPWVFVLAYLIGVGLGLAFPISHLANPLLLTSHISGFVLMLLGCALAGWCLGLFRTSRTTTVPSEKSRQLIESGPYRLSRNPMYVSLTLMYCGEAGILAQGLPLLMLPFVLVYLSKVIIPVEEARLVEVFGDTYSRYCARVRRWV